MPNTLWLRNVWKWVRWVFLAVIVILLLIPPILYFVYRRYVYISTDSVPNNQGYALVLGAAVSDEDTPSSALQDRLDAARELYVKGKVDKILVSGSRNSEFYDEPKAMKNALVKVGVPEDAIIEDGEGYHTADSCRRAKEVYGLSKVIVVSQGFHLPRALFLCRSFGIEATGVYATGNFSTYYSRWYTVREVLAMYLAVFDVLHK